MRRIPRRLSAVALTTAPCLLALVARPDEPADRQARFEKMIETQQQTIVVRLDSPAAAERAVLKPLALYGGAEWAITSRWDDNNPAHLKMRKVLLAHGQSGTFFLNEPPKGPRGRPSGPSGRDARSELGRLLIGDGITIGGHSLTHPMLTYQNRNRIFEEVLGCRIALEAAYDTLVNAYSFSFCNFRSDLEGAEVQRDIGEVLGRAGYLQVANHRFADACCWPLGVTALLPPDGRPIDKRFAQYLRDKTLRGRNPGITFSMHTWYKTPEAWAKFEGELDRYGRRPNWWYCSHNAYGAYRAQYGRAVHGKPTRAKDTISFTFDRPVLIDLNDPVPLTFELAGVEPAKVKGIEAAGARIERIASPEGVLRFHLHHPGASPLPRRTDHLATEDGKPVKSAKFPGVEGALSFDGSALRLHLRNGGSAALRQVRVTYRLPLLARRGVVRRERFDLAGGTTHADVLALEELRDDPRYRAGVYYVAAQLDFAHKGAGGRLYLTTHSPGADDESHPRCGFSILGPIPREAIDLNKLDPRAVRKAGWDLGNGRKLTFRAVDPAIAEPLNVEVIAVRGKWDNRGLEPCVYLLASTVRSPRKSEIRLRRDPATVPAVWLNGRRTREVTALQAGDNDLLLAYEPPAARRFAPELAGPALRLVDARTGNRLPDIRYRP